MKLHYLDNAATTRVSEKAAEAAARAMRETFGNPSSVHALGIEAEGVVRSARESVAEALGCESGEVLFTSGGTESNNTAILRGAEAARRHGKHLITTAVEHPSVLECFKKLEQSGWEVDYLSATTDGSVDLDALEKLVRADTALLSMMLVCNETGVRLPVEQAGRILKAKNPNALLHVDAVQAFGKERFAPKRLGADLLSVSAHKIHGPKGVGALYIRKGLNLAPLIFGGGQERGLRSGTEPVPTIVGFGVAASEARELLDEASAKIDALRTLALDELKKLPNVRVIASGGAVISIAHTKFPSEVSIRLLEGKGVFLSGGSACAKGHASHVLAAMKVDKKLIDGALRISFSRENDEEDVRAMIDALKGI